MRTRFTRSLLGLSLAAAALLAASACSDQAEGERCSTDNNNTDCETGLICKQLSALGETDVTRTAGVCCPLSGPATTEECTAQGSAIPGDGGPNGRVDARIPSVPDASMVPVPVPDASIVPVPPEASVPVPLDAKPAAQG